jgi:hypothetical protein
MRVLLLALLPAAIAAPRSADVIVYGATASGVMASIAAAREGASVLLLEPRTHAGGMLTGGLGRTDMDRQQRLIGGLAREFFLRTGRHYKQDLAWFFEPSVAENILRAWLAESKVEVLFNHSLLRVRKDGVRIIELETRNNARFTAKVFIDSTYEGDLLKAAGVSYAVGRESRSKYGESCAGRQELLPGSHQLRVPTSPFDAKGNLVPYVRPEEDLVPIGEGDGKVMGWGYRLCLTDNPANRLPIEKPAGYDPARFGLVRNYVTALGDSATVGDFLGISPMPNNKTDANATRVSTNLLGAGLPYIEADWDTRNRILEEHRSWAHGLLWFLANDSAVPEKLRRDIARWGLPKDEFIDTGHWPHQLYIREARRMTGEYILTQHDLQTRRTKYDSIGMASYNIDIREVQWIAKTVTRFPGIGKAVIMEGYLSVPVEPYEIPYRALLPRFSECSNLLVSAAISASHVAYASFRMEPQYMIAGHSAGVAAAMAARAGIAPHRLDIAALQQCLRAQKQILSAAEMLADFRLKVDSAVPARYYLTGPGGKPYTPQGAIAYSRRAENHFITQAGFEIELPAGEYTLRAERGPEYRPFETTFEARPAAGQTIKIDIPRWINLNAQGWYSGDLHNHRRVEEMPLLLLADDLNLAPTITDWIWDDKPNSTPPDTAEAIREVDPTHVYSVLDKEIERLRSGPGAIDLLGLRTPLPFSGTLYHPTNEYFAREARARGAWIDAEKIVWRDSAALAALGLIDFAGIVYNHFNRHDVETETDAWGMIPKDKPEYRMPEGMPLWAMDVYYAFLNCGLHLPVSAGSASGVKAAPLGYNRVYVKPPGDFSYDNWFRALKAGRSFATNGPMLTFTVDGKDAGERIRITRPRRLRVRAAAQSLNPLDRLEIVHKGQVVKSVSGRANLQIDFEFNASQTGWLAARAFEKFDRTARFAHTSPVYIERPGDRGIVPAAADFFIRWIDHQIGYYRQPAAIEDPAHRAAMIDFFQRARAFYAALQP